MSETQSPNYLVRRVNASDYFNGHLELYKQLTIINPDEMSEESYKKFIDSLNNEHMIFVVWSLEDKKIVGTGTILIETKLIHNFGKVCHIEDVVVDKEHRGKGIGNSLIDAIITYAKTKDVYKIILDTQEATTKFYKKSGFEIKGVQMAIYNK